VVVALVGLVLSAPFWLAAAVAIKLTSPGPVLHRAQRVGKDGRLFTIHKFRTMRVVSGARITSSTDSRITAVGAVLRRLKIDELPQLVDVLIGSMSMVGPRPEDPRFVSTYTPEQRRVLTVRPGITSPAALAYVDEASLIGAAGGDPEAVYLERVLPAKLALDLDYVDRRTLWLDLFLVGRTAVAVLRIRRRTA
jgi:lipopolysaccharide/colanic/teichoic acid biosynthesis glycosyltransferase